MKEQGPASMKPNQVRHSENLHGKPGVDGLTGFYHGIFYDRGIPATSYPKPIDVFVSPKIDK